MAEGKVATDPVDATNEGKRTAAVANAANPNSTAAKCSVAKRGPNHPSLGGPVTGMNSRGMMGQPSANILAMNMYIKDPHSLDSEAFAGIIDATNRMALLKSTTSQQGQLVHNSSGSMAAALQQIQGRPHLTADIKSEVNLGPVQKSLPIDPSSMYGQAILQSKSGLGSAGNSC
ncbi:hypothetical protein Dimus_016587 [Dionaea muscipula]